MEFYAYSNYPGNEEAGSTIQVTQGMLIRRLLLQRLEIIPFLLMMGMELVVLPLLGFLLLLLK